MVARERALWDQADRQLGDFAAFFKLGRLLSDDPPFRLTPEAYKAAEDIARELGVVCHAS